MFNMVFVFIFNISKQCKTIHNFLIKHDKGEHAPPEPRQESSSCEDNMGQVGSGADGGGGGDDGDGD